MEHLVLDISEEPGTIGTKGEREGRDASRESQGQILQALVGRCLRLGYPRSRP